MRDRDDFWQYMIDKGFNIKVEHCYFDMYLKEIDQHLEFLIKEFAKTFFNTSPKAINASRRKGLEESIFYHNSIHITESNIHKVKNIHLRSIDYVLDHIIPLSFAFKHGIDPAIIGHESNLQILTNLENLKKSNKITDQVQEKLKEFNLIDLKPIDIHDYDIDYRRHSPISRVYKQRSSKPKEINYYTKEMELLQTELL